MGEVANVHNQTNDNPFIGWTTIKDAADQLGREYAVLRYWAEQGYIRSYVVGKNTRLVYFEEVKDYAEQRRRLRME